MGWQAIREFNLTGRGDRGRFLDIEPHPDGGVVVLSTNQRYFVTLGQLATGKIELNLTDLLP